MKKNILIAILCSLLFVTTGYAQVQQITLIKGEVLKVACDSDQIVFLPTGSNSGEVGCFGLIKSPTPLFPTFLPTETLEPTDLPTITPPPSLTSTPVVGTFTPSPTGTLTTPTFTLTLTPNPTQTPTLTQTPTKAPTPNRSTL